ncbi:MAG: lipoprotein [Roseiarcus sp.]
MTLASPPIPARRVVALLLVLGVAFGASSCGRRGPLEPPPDASALAPTPAATPKPADDPLASMTPHKDVPITPPKTPFALDPLL